MSSTASRLVVEQDELSNKAISWAWKIKMPPNAKLYLLTLADRADDDGHCFPSIGDSADRTGLSRDRIVYLNSCLADAGVMTIHKGNARKVNHYTLSVGTGFEVPLKFPRQNRSSTHGRTVTLTEPSYNHHSATNVAGRSLRARPHAIEDDLKNAHEGVPSPSAGGRKDVASKVRASPPRPSQPSAAEQESPQPPGPRWPTEAMIGFARKRGLDPEEVADLIRERIGDPKAGDDLRSWGQAFYAMCNGVIGGYEDSVCSGIGELEANLSDDADADEPKPPSAQILSFMENLNVPANAVVNWAATNGVDLDRVLNALRVRHGWPAPNERAREAWGDRFKALCQEDWHKVQADKAKSDQSVRGAA